MFCNLRYIYALLSLISTSALAFDNTECLSNTTAELKIYRDENEKVRCVHYGQGKSVEYLYTTEEKTIQGQVFVQGALITKKPHNMSDPLDNLRWFSPATPGFQELMLAETLLEINDIKTLPALIQEFYPDPTQRKELVNQMLIDQNIQDPQSEDWLADLQKIQQADMKNYHSRISSEKSEGLTADEEDLIVRTLQMSFNEQVSVQQCNSLLFDSIATWVVAGIVKTKVFDDDTVGLTRVEQKMPYIYLSRDLFSEWHLTIAQSKPNTKTTKHDIQKDKLLYFRNPNFSPSMEYRHLSHLSRILTHEMGHAKTFQLFDKYPETYKLDGIFLNLAVAMADENKFPMIPENIKRAIETQIIDSFKQTIEYAAEIYFIDNLPCVL